MDYIIKAQGLTFSYDDDGNGSKTVENLDFTIERGSFTAIIGHNGSGKSTIAKLMCGVLEPTSGEVYIDSKRAARVLRISSDDDIYDVRGTVGMVFQNPDNQLVATVVEEDVAFAPENLGVPAKDIRKKVDEALKSVGLYEYRLHDTHKLSGGQKQRVAIAGILAMEPECVIFDESTAMLDPKGRDDVMKIIRKMRDEMGITVVLITHYMNEAAQSDRIMVVDGGKIILDGTPKEVFEKDSLLVEKGLEVPHCTELMKKLFDAGETIEKTVLDTEEAANILFELLYKKQN
jgi:energy-coupling factor transport system ATP-binding protein